MRSLNLGLMNNQTTTGKAIVCNAESHDGDIGLMNMPLRDAINLMIDAIERHERPPVIIDPALIAAAEGSEKAGDPHTPISRGSHPGPAPGVPARTFQDGQVSFQTAGSPDLRLKAGDVLPINFAYRGSIIKDPVIARMAHERGLLLNLAREMAELQSAPNDSFEWVANANSAAVLISSKGPIDGLAVGPARLAPGEDATDWFGLYRVRQDCGEGAGIPQAD